MRFGLQAAGVLLFLFIPAVLYLFVAHPEILGIDASFGYTAMVSAMALLGIIALNVVIEGFLLRPLNLGERLLLLPAAFGLVHPSIWASVAGLAVFGAIAGWQWAALRRAQPAQTGTAPGS